MCGRGEGAAGDLGEESGCGPDTDSGHTGQDRVKRVSKNSLFYLKRHLVSLLMQRDELECQTWQQYYGSVISGNNVQLAGGNITNSGGSINAQNDLSLDSTGYIDNLNAGLRSAGGSPDLSAIGDISNISSVISGKTVQLESVSGNISNITRRQQWNAGSDSRYGGVHLSGTDTGPVATIKGTDSLSLDAGKTLILPGQRSRPVETLECLRVMTSTLPQT